MVNPTGLTASITPLALTVTGLSANSKVYDAGTAATLSGTATVAALGSDAVTVTGSGTGSTFAARDVGTRAVTVTGLALGGANAGNYTLVAPTGLSAAITPATLTYAAAPSSQSAGQTPSGLSGTVTGFLGSDTAANSTTGAASWTSRATASSAPGVYAVDGSGLGAANYRFIEATGNATALTLKASRPTPAVLDVMASLQAGLLQSNGPVKGGSLPANFNSTGMQDPVSGSAGGPTVTKGVAFARDSSQGQKRQLLRIVGTGVRLPANMLAVTP